MSDLDRRQLELHDKAIIRLEGDVLELRRQMNAALNQLGAWIASDDKKRSERQAENDKWLTRLDKGLQDGIVAAGLAYAEHRKTLDEQLVAHSGRRARLLYIVIALETLGIILLIGLLLGRLL